MKYFFLVFLGTVLGSCQLRKNGSSGDGHPVFDKIIFHSGFCFGTCPKIDMEINSSRDMLLNREILIGRGQTDTSKSGGYKGLLEQQKFNELVQAVQSSNYAAFRFPDILCCDGPVITMIIYSNGKRTYLKSMMPPKEAEGLISYLRNLALETVLPKTSEAIKIEE